MSEDLKTATNAARGRQPVTWHPLFPAIVAMWFGALFGLGTLAIRVSLIERIALASGIDRLVPAAAPPLGMTARILIALALALLGGIIGAVIGRTIARSKPATRARRAAAAEAAAEVTEPAPLQAEPAEAPAFNPAPSFIDISQLDLADEHKIESELSTIDSDAAARGDAAIEAPNEDGPVREFHHPLAPATFPLPASFPVPGGAAAQRLNAADLDSLSHLELIERLALSLQKRREAAAASEPSDEAPSPSPGPEVPSYYPSAPEPIARRFAATPEADPAQIIEAGGADTRPVALFPPADAAPAAALRQDRTGTERALRDALAALQRMSGAA